MKTILQCILMLALMFSACSKEGKIELRFENKSGLDIFNFEMLVSGKETISIDTLPAGEISHLFTANVDGWQHEYRFESGDELNTWKNAYSIKQKLCPGNKYVICLDYHFGTSNEWQIGYDKE